MKDEVNLYKTKLAFQHQVPEVFTELIDGKLQIRGDVGHDWVRNQLRAQLSGYLWSEPGPTQTIKYPADWWDAFKARWFPVWLLNRYPAVYQCHEISLNTLYPLFHVSLPNETSVLKFDVKDYKQSSGDEEQKAIDIAEPGRV